MRTVRIFRQFCKQKNDRGLIWRSLRHGLRCGRGMKNGMMQTPNLRSDVTAATGSDPHANERAFGQRANAERIRIGHAEEVMRNKRSDLVAWECRADCRGRIAKLAMHSVCN